MDQVVLFLSDDEKVRFVSYLRSEIFSASQILEQTKKLPNMEPIIKRVQIEIAAMELIANRLDSTETMET